MKVLFFITAKGHGRGGHFYSLRSTVESLSAYLDVAVVNVGPSRSPVLDSAPFRVVTVPYDGSSLDRHSRAIEDVVRREQPSVLHAFDLESLYFARRLSCRMRVPLMFTKCGGPNPKWYFPRISNLIVYSAENFLYFSDASSRRFDCLLQIPNRVTKPRQDDVRIRELRARLKPDRLVVLRISRLTRYYRASLVQAANLVKRLNDDAIPAQLLAVGAIQDDALAREIVELAGGAAIVVGEERYTANAAELIDVADLVVGTGRGFMEAAISGKIVLAPVTGSAIPVLVTPRTLQSFFDSNFSERSALPGLSELEEYAAIKRICGSSEERRELAAFIERFATDNFEVSAMKQKYLDLYANLVFKRTWCPIDMWLHRIVARKSLTLAQSALIKTQVRFESASPDH